MRPAIPAIITAALLLAGCSSVGTVASSDPSVKIAQAEDLSLRQGRFLPAKRLLDEALAISQERGDERGIAEAYRGYGLFYRADIPRNSLIPDDFAGKTNGVETRYFTAIDYFKRSAALLEKQQVLARLSNVNFLLAQTFHRVGDVANACHSLEDSRTAHRRAVAADPSLRVQLGRGITSFDQGIDRTRAEFGCPKG